MFQNEKITGNEEMMKNEKSMGNGNLSSVGDGHLSCMENGHNVEAPAVVLCGPWGGGGGTSFYDGIKGDIVEIQVTSGVDHIIGIQTSYIQGVDSLKRSFKATPHGGCTGGYTSKVKELFNTSEFYHQLNADNTISISDTDTEVIAAFSQNLLGNCIQSRPR